MSRREKRPLGDVFGLKAFGVNFTRILPGGVSALHHRHSRQDEFLFVLEGEPTLVTDGGDVSLRPGMCAGFQAAGPAHHLENRTERDVLILEVGDRAVGDEVEYPTEDIQAAMGKDGNWRFAHKDGRPYEMADRPAPGREGRSPNPGLAARVSNSGGSTDTRKSPRKVEAQGGARSRRR